MSNVKLSYWAQLRFAQLNMSRNVNIISILLYFISFVSIKNKPLSEWNRSFSDISTVKLGHQRPMENQPI